MKAFNKLSLVAVCALAVALTACSGKKKTDDAAANSAPTIDSTAMNFDPAGSDSGKIAGLQSINFPYDKAELTAAAKGILKGNSEWLKTNSKVNLQIEGHCDARGSIEYNLALGERRAKAVKDYLVGLGIAEARLSVISYGKEKPLSMGDSDADHAKNRRANFLPLN